MRVKPRFFNDTTVISCYYEALRTNKIPVLEWLFENTKIDVALLNAHIDVLKWCESKESKELKLNYYLTEYPEASKEWFQGYSTRRAPTTQC
jgi:transcription initiation factor IIE alpha subunit